MVLIASEEQRPLAFGQAYGSRGREQIFRSSHLGKQNQTAGWRRVSLSTNGSPLISGWVSGSHKLEKCRQVHRLGALGGTSARGFRCRDPAEPQFAIV